MRTSNSNLMSSGKKIDEESGAVELNRLKEQDDEAEKEETQIVVSEAEADKSSSSSTKKGSRKKKKKTKKESANKSVDSDDDNEVEPMIVPKKAVKRVDTILASSDPDAVRKKIRKVERIISRHDDKTRAQLRSIYRQRGLPLTVAWKQAVLFFMCLLIVLIAMTRSGFVFVTYTRSLTVDKELLFDDSHIKKTFFTLTNVDELWQFLHGPLITGLLGSDDGFTSSLTTKAMGPSSASSSSSSAAAATVPLVYGVNLLMGPVLLRQKRVEPGLARCDDFLADLILTTTGTNNTAVCNAPAYSKQFESTKTFYPDTGNGSGSSNDDDDDRVQKAFMFDWNAQSTDYEGYHAIYDGAGAFVASVPYLDSDAVSFMDRLRQLHWIDESTRVLFVEFGLFNVNTARICIARLVAEIPATGGVKTSALFHAVDPADFARRQNYWRVFLELVFIGLTLVFLAQCIYDVVTAYRMFLQCLDSPTDLDEVKVEEADEAKKKSDQQEDNDDGPRKESFLGRLVLRLRKAVVRVVPRALISFPFVLLVLHTVLGLACIGIRVQLAQVYHRALLDMSTVLSTGEQSGSPPLMDVQRLGETQTLLDGMLGFMGLIVFAHFSLHVIASQASILQVSVVTIALRKFGQFFILFLGLFSGLSVMFHFVYNVHLFSFSSVPRSLLGTLHALLGHRDYDTMRVLSPYFGSLAYLVMLIGGTIFFFNLLIGFLGSAVGDAQRHVHEQRVVRQLMDKADARRRLLTQYQDKLNSHLDDLESSSSESAADESGSDDDSE